MYSTRCAPAPPLASAQIPFALVVGELTEAADLSHAQGRPVPKPSARLMLVIAAEVSTIAASRGRHATRAIGIGKRIALATFVLAVSHAAALATQFTFQGLGAGSSAFAVSGNGAVIAGITPSNSVARWSLGPGGWSLQNLGKLPSSITQAWGRGISSDGLVVVGDSRSTSNGAGEGLEAFRWTQSSGIAGLGGNSSAEDASADGSVVVGSWFSVSPPYGSAFRWTAASGKVQLGALPGDNSSAGQAVSDDGSIVVGQSAINQTVGNRYFPVSGQAFRWSASTGMVGLGNLPGTSSESLATGISAGGSVIVGDANVVRDSNGAILSSEAFRWTSLDGMVGLGDLPGGVLTSLAFDASADGSRIVGIGTSSSGREAAFWQSGTGWVSLKDFLLANGVTSVNGWSLSFAYGIANDGRTIIGTGTDASGQSEAWVATIPVPEPSTLVLSSCGAALLLLLRRRSASKAVRLGHQRVGLLLAATPTTPSYSSRGESRARKNAPAIWAWTLLALLLVDAEVKGATFNGLGFLPGGTTSTAHGVSADGLVIAGIASDKAVIWAGNGAPQPLGVLPGYTISNALFASTDGSVIAGFAGDGVPANHYEPFRWTASTGMQSLGSLNGAYGREPTAMSADGSIIVGRNVYLTNPSQVAFKWTAAGGVQELPVLPNTIGSAAYGISADGSTIVGYDTTSKVNPVRWTAAGIEALPQAPGAVYTVLVAASADGSVIIGGAAPNAISGPYEAFRWTDAAGWQPLGFLSGHTNSSPRAISGDGAVVVGSATANGGTPESAFLWTQSLGMVELKSYLVGHGVSGLTGWTLLEATDISADGRTIVGYGTNPTGNMEAWVATVPEPSAWVLLAMGLAGLVLLRGRKRRGRRIADACALQRRLHVAPFGIATLKAVVAAAGVIAVGMPSYTRAEFLGYNPLFADGRFEYGAGFDNRSVVINEFEEPFFDFPGGPFFDSITTPNTIAQFQGQVFGYVSPAAVATVFEPGTGLRLDHGSGATASAFLKGTASIPFVYEAPDFGQESIRSESHYHVTGVLAPGDTFVFKAFGRVNIADTTIQLYFHDFGTTTVSKAGSFGFALDDYGPIYPGIAWPTVTDSIAYFEMQIIPGPNSGGSYAVLTAGGSGPAVPEPSTFTMTGIAALLLAACVGRQQRRQ